MAGPLEIRAWMMMMVPGILHLIIMMIMTYLMCSRYNVGLISEWHELGTDHASLLTLARYIIMIVISNKFMMIMTFMSGPGTSWSSSARLTSTGLSTSVTTPGLLRCYLYL